MGPRGSGHHRKPGLCSNPALILAELFPRGFILQQANPVAAPAAFPAPGLPPLGLGLYFKRGWVCTGSGGRKAGAFLAA